MISDYEQAEKYILDIPLFSVNDNKRHKSGNNNLSLVLDLLGNPHRKVKSIHIAGTNGKGSTANFIKCILDEMGFKTGIFTSPHLVDIRERIATDDYISKDDFLKCFNTVLSAEDKIVSEGKEHISYFEFLFAMAAVYFAEKKPDYVIYETGLGGRLDATNLINPAVTVITSIGLDHMKYLGNTIELIAKEKAGIIKEGVPVVYNTQNKTADKVISKAAKSHNSKEINVAKTKYIINNLSDKTIDFSLYNSYYKYDNLVINTNALYQVDNALSAIAACNELYKDEGIIDENIIKRALLKFFWSGRMEHIYNNVIIDGAHNEDAIKRFIQTVNETCGKKDKELLFAVCEDKDYEPMIKALCNGLKLSRVYVTKIISKRAAASEQIKELFERYLSDKNTKIICCDNIKEIFIKAVDDVLDKEDKVLFCVGSLYLAGSIKQIVTEAKDD